MTPTPAAFQAILEGRSHDPHAFLGMHPTASGLTVRVFAPGVERVTFLPPSGPELPMRRTHPEGLFQLALPGERAPFPYRLRFEAGGHQWERADPYRFLPTVAEDDLRAFAEGRHDRAWHVLGAHPRTVDGEPGVAFAVWAPNARGVALVGDFNGWNRHAHPMRVLGSSGVWELFVPGIGPGERYKFAVLGADGVLREKADPFAFFQETRPKTASIVFASSFRWADAEWMERRAGADPYREPMSIYEVHLGSWRRHPDGRWYAYRESAEALAAYCRDLGFTHVELLPLAEHPFDGSWGYQVTNFFAPTSRYGTPDDFRAFVDTLHRAGIGVLLDWVPAHFATDLHGLARFDGTWLYEHEDARRRIQPDWGTYSFNYGRNEVRSFLLSNARYWLEEFHIDGLRVDAVSSMIYLDYSRKPGEWVPNIYGGNEHLEAIDFLRRANELVYREVPGAVTIAEESTAWPGVSRPTYAGGLGFGFKWNMGWMHDTLFYLSRDPIHRKYHHNILTFSMLYAYSENYILSLSHDEVVHGKASLLHKMPGDEWQQFANLRLLLAYQHAWPGKKLLFMGGEFGQRSEWSHDRELEWQALSYFRHEGVQRLVRDLNRLHRTRPALHRCDHEPRGFAWLDFSDWEQSVVAFVRRTGEADDDVVCVFNFTPVPRFGYRIPVPAPGPYQEILNTDADVYGGSGVGNLGLAVADPEPRFGWPASMAVTLPPLAAVFFAPVR
ncbi:1,4-alpha-glucan branching enzyme GlgB [bacterium HR29]|jgi:1,4-alpha-glucan branching enzyme|nr:1,4-alpha-glucan branching enzyme GlgB [bacterium HR29]